MTRWRGVGAALLLALLAGAGSVRAQDEGNVLEQAATVLCVAVGPHEEDQVCERALLTAVAEQINARLEAGYKATLGDAESETGRRTLGLDPPLDSPASIRIDSLAARTPADVDCDARYAGLLGTPISVFQSDQGQPVVLTAPGFSPPSDDGTCVPLCLRWPACTGGQGAAPDPGQDAIAQAMAGGSDSDESGDEASGEEGARTPAEDTPETQEPSSNAFLVIGIISIIAIATAMVAGVFLIHLFREHGGRLKDLESRYKRLNKTTKNIEDDLYHGVGLPDEIRELPARVSRIETEVRQVMNQSNRDRAIPGTRQSPRDPDALGRSPSREQPYDRRASSRDPYDSTRAVIEVFRQHVARQAGAPEPEVPFEWQQAWLLEDGRILDHSDSGVRVWVVPFDRYGDSALAIPDPTWIRDKLSMIRSSPVNPIADMLHGAFETSKRMDRPDPVELIRPATVQRQAGGTWAVRERGALAYRPA